MESARGEQRDRLSELPHSIILHILSLLPIRDAIKTTFLSNHWKNLWTTVPNLNFTDMYANEDFEDGRVRNFVNRTLLFWKGPKVLKFNFVSDFEFDDSDIDLWVRFAVDHNVEELNIGLVYSSGARVWEDAVTFTYMPPQCLNSCSSITKLSLVGCNLQINGNPSWNQLKSLRIDGFCFSKDLMNRIMLGSPLLEDLELRIMESNEDLNIQSTSLKELKIHKYLCHLDEPSPNTMLRVCCPNLQTLEMSGILYSNYRLENVSFLSEASFGFDDSYAYARGKHEYLFTKLRDLFSTLEHVERVTLSNWCFKVLSASENLLGPLPNVKYLKYNVHSVELDRTVNLLANFPNLKMLVIEVGGGPADFWFLDKPLDLEKCPSASSLLHRQLRTVEIHAPVENPQIFQFIGFLLNHCSMLQKFVIWAKGITLRYPPMFMFKVSKELLSLQKSHPTTEVILNTHCPVTKIADSKSQKIRGDGGDQWSQLYEYLDGWFGSIHQSLGAMDRRMTSTLQRQIHYWQLNFDRINRRMTGLEQQQRQFRDWELNFDRRMDSMEEQVRQIRDWQLNYDGNNMPPPS